MCPHWTICRLQHVWASKILDGRRHQGNGERDPRRARPGCSTTAFAAPDRRVIESQSVRLSANFLRPERRSTDGQVILKAISGKPEDQPDLLLCGAPLRNRTVDLLLTIHTSLGSLPGKHFPQAADKRQPGSCPGRRHCDRSGHRLQPGRSWHGSTPSVRSARPRRVCQSSPASGAACRPATSTPTVKGRSDDLSYPAAQDPKTTLSRRSPSPGKI